MRPTAGATGRRPRALWLPAPDEAAGCADWSTEADCQVQRLPPIVRGVVRNCVERYTRRRGLDVITPAVVRAARAAARV